MEAYVFIFANETKVPLALSPSTPVSDVKSLVLKNIPTDLKINSAEVRRVRLLSNGRELTDSDTLEKIASPEGSHKYVHVVLSKSVAPTINHDVRECCDECSLC